MRASGTAFRHGWPSAKCSSKQRPGPWGRVCFGCGPRALRFVTVGFRPNAPHSSAPALGGGCAACAGHGRCVSSRLACGQMFLKAAPPALGGGCASGAGHGRCVSSRLACGQMLLTAAPRPLGAGALQVRAMDTAFRHGWPAAKCSSQQRPRPAARGSASKFSTKNAPNVENTRKE